MLVPLRWLFEWCDVPAAPSVDALAEALTMNGLEVDSIARTGPDLSQIVVGHVLTREKHPDADKLSLCTVDVGEGEPRQIVCGAPNVAAGQKVAVAVPGVKLQGKKLKKSKIRGVSSHGMICSESELELSQEHDGILVLPADATVGAALDSVIQAGEVVLEIAITANRGDCASLIGVAREVCAYFGGTLRVPDVEVSEGQRKVAEDVSVSVDDSDGCYRYAGRVVRGVSVGASPPEWVERLEAAGLRSLNNVVDATNLVLLEFGQPLHAFDLAKLGEGQVRVRSAADGELITTLDGEERKLVAGDLVIADAKRAIALAGVMGGADSEVGAGTTDILLESAHFKPGRVRATAKRLGISTDASYRFEREVDPEGIERAIDRCAALIAEHAGGTVSAGIALALGDPVPTRPEIALEPARVNRILGTELSAAEIQTILGRLEVAVTAGPGDTLVCRPPSHRNDLSIPVDLVEEVARIHGLSNIAPTRMQGTLAGAGKPAVLGLGDRARDSFVADGLIEVHTMPFAAPSDLDKLRLPADDARRNTVRVLNPIVEGEPVLRPSQLGSLLHIVRENRARQVERIDLFEVSRVFQAASPDAAARDLFSSESWRALGVVTARDAKGLWDGREEPPIFYRAKGVAERLLAALGHSGARMLPGSDEPYLHPGAAMTLRVGKANVGSLGELHPEVARAFEIDVPCALVEVDLDLIAEQKTRVTRYSEVSKHPRVRRDLALFVASDCAAGDLLAAAKKQGGGDLVSAELFDRYAGKGVPEGQVSLALRLVFQRLDRTLKDDEVNRAVDRVVAELSERFGATLRGG